MANQQVHDPLGPIKEGEFQRIQGIGPGIEKRLHAAGITTFNHLASMTAEEILAMLNGMVGMTTERISRQNWPGKARQLAKELSESQPTAVLDKPVERQHYASFMVELLQEKDHTVRLTRVVQVQNGEKDAWAGWDAGRLVLWMADESGCHLAAPLPVQGKSTAENPHASKKAPALNKLEANSLASQTSILLEWDDLYLDSQTHTRPFLDEGQPFELHATLRFAEGTRPQLPLVYRAEGIARPVVGSKSQPVCSAAGMCSAGEVTSLSLAIPGMDEGTYRLLVSVLVYPEGAAVPEQEGQTAFIEGGLVHIYSRECV
jgi:hypothetical protein